MPPQPVLTQKWKNIHITCIFINLLRQVGFNEIHPSEWKYFYERNDQNGKKVQNYEVLLDSANEAASAYLDMEGGEFLLAWAGELIQDLAAEGNVRSAALAAKKLCEAVDVEMQWEAFEESQKAEKQAWLSLFAEALMDCAEVS